MRSIHAALVALVLAAPVFAGCITNDALAPGSTAPPLDPALGPIVSLLEGDAGFRLRQAVDVYLVGFAPGTGEALQAYLTPEEVVHMTGSFPRTFPPDPSDPQVPVLAWEETDNPVVAVAEYRVVQVDEATAAALFAAMAAMEVESGIYDANAAEDLLATELPAAGYAIDATRPAYVVLHAGDALPDGHAWRYTYSHGYLQPVRTFGERQPILVTDASAAPDPFVTGQGLVSRATGAPPRGKAYDYPLEAEGDATLEALDLLVRDATHYRLLKGAIYPISTKPCHHVTLILAIHTTTLAQYGSMFRPPEEWVDVAGIEAGFENLTGEDVLVDYKVLRLPQDEPVLDALARGAGAFVTLDAMRYYIDENFDRFVDAEEGCEEYLGLTVFADASTMGAFLGIGTYDVKRSHRIAFSIVPEWFRFTDDGGEVYEALGRADESRTPNWVNLLFAHEVGHILGQHHPQHLSKKNDPSPPLDSFQSVWSVMSYQTDDRIHDFGQMDRGQWLRNRAGFAVQEAQMHGLTETPEFQDAMRHLELYHWEAAFDALAPALAAASAAGHEHALPPYHVVDRHWHPWFEEKRGR